MLSYNDFKKLKFVQDVTSRYHFGRVIGQGAFGTVKLCYQLNTDKALAAKILSKK